MLMMRRPPTATPSFAWKRPDIENYPIRNIRRISFAASELKAKPTNSGSQVSRFLYAYLP